ncbi:MAG: PKD domain-containing protein [Gemmatimonadota bacterium]|nr:PKD domain-containing protein [Gemmatimonadota bacterium]MDH5758917.1 PKD domain-containing protein [Gemmatimonadota bacterium]
MNRTSLPLVPVLTLALAACGAEQTLAPLPETETTAAAVAGPSLALSGSDPYFLFGHQDVTRETWKIDPSTWTSQNLGPTGFNTAYAGMATSTQDVQVAGGHTVPAGTVFGLFRIDGVDRVMIIDTQSGDVLPVVDLQVQLPQRGIEFGPDGTTLYAIDRTGTLSTLDLMTGAVTSVGATVPAEALAYDPDTGTFITGSGQFLYRVDPATGAATRLGVLYFQPCTINRSPEGRWFIFYKNFVREITDLNTGTMVRMGSVSNSFVNALCGSAWAPVRPVAQTLPPSADAGGAYSGVEGSPVSFVGSAADFTGAALAYAWDFGDGSTGTGASAGHAYVDDGTYTITLTVTDETGASASATTTATVANVAPVAAAGPGAVLNQGDVFTFAGSFTDVGIADTWTWTVDFGDGSAVAGASAAQGSVSTEHAYTEAGTFTVTFTVTDDDAGTHSDQVDVTVLPPIEIAIDVHGGGALANGNGRSNGNLTVVLIADGEFAAEALIASSLTLGDGIGTETSVVDKNGGPWVTLEDVDADGDLDAVARFAIADLRANGDLDNASAGLVIAGSLTSGRVIRGFTGILTQGPRSGR